MVLIGERKFGGIIAKAITVEEVPKKDEIRDKNRELGVCFLR
jgi:hypothetical protein